VWQRLEYFSPPSLLAGLRPPGRKGEKRVTPKITEGNRINVIILLLLPGQKNFIYHYLSLFKLASDKFLIGIGYKPKLHADFHFSVACLFSFLSLPFIRTRPVTADHCEFRNKKEKRKGASSLWPL